MADRDAAFEKLMKACLADQPTDWRDSVKGFTGAAYRFSKYMRAVRRARELQRQYDHLACLEAAGLVAVDD